MQDKWTERLNRDRVLFEVANRVLITITWVSLCIVVCTIFIRSYYTPAPALVAMKHGRILFLGWIAFAVVISVITSSALLWSMVRSLWYLKKDIEESRLIIRLLLIPFVIPAFYYALAMFVIILITTLSVQVLVSVGEITPQPRVMQEDPWNQNTLDRTENPDGR